MEHEQATRRPSRGRVEGSSRSRSRSRSTQQEESRVEVVLVLVLVLVDWVVSSEAVNKLLPLFLSLFLNAITRHD